jgi:ribonuclease D
LIQVVVGQDLFLIDAVKLGNCDRFWTSLATSGAALVTHAARAELLFAYQANGAALERLFDVQIAAGLVGIEYPAAYGTLVQRLIGTSISKSETRSDWRRRPLSQRQIEYALDDVSHLPRLHEMLQRKLEQRGRLPWMEDEMREWQSQVILAEYSDPWRRLSGVAGLSPRSTQIARKLWEWRDQTARQQNKPPRRVLRDDLLVELARREMSSAAQIRLLRGMERRGHQKDIPAIAAAIAQAAAAPEDQWPDKPQRPKSGPDMTLLGQFLYTGFGLLCRDLGIATSLVGSVQDVRDLAAWQLKLGDPQQRPPRLATGWRAKVIGQTIGEMLSSRWAIAIERPTADQPLRLVPIDRLPDARKSERAKNK